MPPMRLRHTIQKNFFQKLTDDASVDAYSIFEKELLGKVVAGAGFEPTTFGL